MRKSNIKDNKTYKKVGFLKSFLRVIIDETSDEAQITRTVCLVQEGIEKF